MGELISAMVADSQSRYNKELTDIALRTANSRNVGHKGTFSVHISQKVQTKLGSINVPVYKNEVIDFRGGPIHHTGNPYHAALSGDGFFIVDVGEGKLLLTRRGNFQLNQASELITPEGHLVQGQGGPIVLPPQDGPYKIGTDGTISNANGVVNKLLIQKVSEADLKSLKEAGGYFLKPDQAQLIEAENYTVVHQAVEKSNTLVQMEAAHLAEVSKNVATLKKFASELYETQKNLVRDLGKMTG